MQVRCFIASAFLLWSGAVVAAPVIADAADPPKACLQYDGHSTELSGTLFSRNYYGPPGYGENPKQDARESAWLLLLDAPICVVASDHPEKDNNAGERDQIVVQLAAVHVEPERIQKVEGRRVTVTGQLYHALTGHHRTPVLLDVYSVSAP